MQYVPSLGPHDLRPLTDLGNAERLIDMFGHEMRYVTAWKSWIIWDGTRWKRDETQEIDRRAKQTVRGIPSEVAALTATQATLPPDEQLPLERLQKLTADIYKHAKASEAEGKVRAMTHLAQSPVAITPNVLDANPWLFNVRNGVLDLRTGKLRAHDPDDLLTKRSDVTFEATASCPIWIAFLKRIFDDEQPLIDYLQRAIGYTLTGDTGEQLLHMCHGSGANGKSTFLEAISGLLGEYAIAADFTSFLDAKQSGAREDLARLAGARFVRSSEVGEGKRLNESLIRSLTGNETVAARFLYSGTFEFKPQFKLWFAVNHKPVIRGSDYATWRRIRLVPFLVTIPLDDRDQELGAKLMDELSGILNWALAGCLKWRKEGLKAPAIVQLVSDQFRAESDVLGHFLEECCDLDSSYYEASSDLYKTYKRWADENGEGQLTMTMFGRKLDDRGHIVSKSHGIKRRHGLRLQSGVVTANGQKPWF